MSEGQRLQFVEPSAQAFVDALLGSPAPVSAVLVGEGPLATEIAAKASSSGVALDIQPHLPEAAALGYARFLILTERDGDRLGEQLLDCLDLSDIRVIAPVTARHFSRMPLFVVSIPKAGTHLVYELAQALGYAPGVELPDFPKPQTWYCVEYSNSHTVARDFFVDTVRRAPFGNRHHPITRAPVLFAYRHPLDVLVSEAHYYHRDGKTVFAGYFDGEEFDERVRRLIDDEWMMGSLRQRMGGFLPWLRFPNVIPASFEELVGEAGGGSAAAQRRLIWSILLKLQVDGGVGEIAAKVFNQNSATFREGRIGAWRSQLSPAHIEELGAKCGDILTAFGYSIRTDSLLPAMAVQYAMRPLHYSTEDFDRMPLTVEADFVGCNLVRYARRFYAVPLSAGAMAIDQLSEEQLARLPVAATLSELKAVLLIGRKAHDRLHTQLSDAGTALRQSTGPADLSQDQTLFSRYTVGDVHVSHDFDDLIADRDGSSIVMCAISRLDQRLREVSDRHAAERGASELERDERAKRETELICRFEALEKNVFVRLGKHLADFFRRGR